MSATDPVVFAFVFDIHPGEGAVNADKGTDFCADVWVSHPDRGEAETMARALIMDYGYRAGNLEAAKAIRASEISGYRPDAQRDFHRAIQHGIAIAFAGQLPPGHAADTVEFHRMEKPRHPSGSKH